MNRLLRTIGTLMFVTCACGYGQVPLLMQPGMGPPRHVYGYALLHPDLARQLRLPVAVPFLELRFGELPTVLQERVREAANYGDYPVRCAREFSTGGLFLVQLYGSCASYSGPPTTDYEGRRAIFLTPDGSIKEGFGGLLTAALIMCPSGRNVDGVLSDFAASDTLLGCEQHDWSGIYEHSDSESVFRRSTTPADVQRMTRPRLMEWYRNAAVGPGAGYCDLIVGSAAVPFEYGFVHLGLTKRSQLMTRFQNPGPRSQQFLLNERNGTAGRDQC